MRESTNITWGERADAAFCEDCLAYGADAVVLRICLSCGHIGCAEGSPGDHAAEHYAETDHPVAAAIGSPPTSRWSYPDERAL
ncbi:MAG: UBP-type zinc finger domain-containing protein [Actinomycetota bacterium]|nr:UBP-type zinc finger domain-containing protein [Actinomycetota bacterium]